MHSAIKPWRLRLNVVVYWRLRGLVAYEAVCGSGLDSYVEIDREDWEITRRRIFVLEYKML